MMIYVTRRAFPMANGQPPLLIQLGYTGRDPSIAVDAS